MLKRIAELTLSNVEKSDAPSNSSSFNNSNSNAGNNNITHITTNNFFNGQSTIAKKDKLTLIENQIEQSQNDSQTLKNYVEDQKDENEAISNNLTILEDQKDEKEAILIVSTTIENKKELYLEVFPNDQLIIKLIWKYLKTVDKFNCTLVCKRFNNIISGIHSFRLIVDLPPSSMVKVIPIISRNYKKVLVKNYQSNKMKAPMYKMLEHLGSSLVDLCFQKCQFDLLTVCKLLGELPLLKYLELRFSCKMENNVELSIEDLPKLLKLQTLKLSMNYENMNDTLAIFGCSKIQSLTILHANINMKELKDVFKQHKDSLKYLAINYCTFFIDPMYSQFKFGPTDFSCFDCLHKLSQLTLLNNSSTLNILKTKCINWLQDLEIFYDYYQEPQINSFLLNFFLLKQVDKQGLSKYVPSKGPIRTKTICPLTETIITTYFHVRSRKIVENIYMGDWKIIYGRPYKLFINGKLDANNFKFNVNNIKNTNCIKSFFKWK